MNQPCKNSEQGNSSPGTYFLCHMKKAENSGNNEIEKHLLGHGPQVLVTLKKKEMTKKSIKMGAEEVNQEKIDAVYGQDTSHPAEDKIHHIAFGKDTGGIF